MNIPLGPSAGSDIKSTCVATIRRRRFVWPEKAQLASGLAGSSICFRSQHTQHQYFVLALAIRKNPPPPTGRCQPEGEVWGKNSNFFSQFKPKRHIFFGFYYSRRIMASLNVFSREVRTNCLF
jgi:hypothetical protein